MTAIDWWLCGAAGIEAVSAIGSLSVALYLVRWCRVLERRVAALEASTDLRQVRAFCDEQLARARGYEQMFLVEREKYERILRDCDCGGGRGSNGSGAHPHGA